MSAGNAALSQKPTVLDGAMGTTLQRLGLPAGVPGSAWNLERPEAVAAVHRAFVDAGAEAICTNTLCCLPGRPGWREELEAGVALAAGAGVPVWLSLGPGAGHAEAVRAAGCDAVVLETFVDPWAGLEAARAVRAVHPGPVVLSVVPLDGTVPAGVAEEAVRLGLTGIGVNCVPASQAARALEGLELPLWVKPSGATAAELVALASRARWIGGCCGTGPEVIAELAATLSAGRGSGSSPR
ncbi:MAG: homocysteine S-methyltransferase family protein [Alphaproteobacteria bacterium]|nr:homocysteine S-methyltransferase family protein [Alphaproteobacteria bacterium]